MNNWAKFFEGVSGIAVGLVFIFISFQMVDSNNQFTGVGVAFFLGGILAFVLGIYFIYRGLAD